MEIHLATNFQTIVFDHPRLPADLRAEINAWVKVECKDEWKKLGLPLERAGKPYVPPDTL